MSRQNLSVILVLISSILAVAAAATLIPHSAPTVSDLGYYTLCPFAPWSTLTLLFFAGLGWIVRQHIKSLPAD
jgi:hypothetical protein